MPLRTPLSGPGVWLGKDIANSPRWVKTLPAGGAAELAAAVAAVNRRGLDWKDIRRADFPLPTLAPFLADVTDELENGCGIVKITGMTVANHDEDDLRRLYFGIGTHVGTPVFQNRTGELMRAIRDEGAHVGRTYGQIEGKGTSGGTFLSSYARTLTNGGLRYHTDRTDVVGLLCVRQAMAGGISKLGSTPAIHNAILERRPDLLDELFKPFWRSRLGEESTDPATVYALPIFGLRDGKFTSHYSLTFIEAAEMVPGVPKLTSAQRQAIDMLMSVAEEVSFSMTLEPGDLQLINSHVTYHGRTPFEDDFNAGKSRMLLRLWLSMANSRPLPDDHAVLWRDVRAGAVRGGIAQDAR